MGSVARIQPVVLKAGLRLWKSPALVKDRRLYASKQGGGMRNLQSPSPRLPGEEHGGFGGAVQKAKEDGLSGEN